MYGDPREMLFPARSATDCLIRSNPSHCRLVCQIENHTADICFVRNRIGVKFKRNGIADRLRVSNCLICRCRNKRFQRRNTAAASSCFDSASVRIVRPLCRTKSMIFATCARPLLRSHRSQELASHTTPAVVCQAPHVQKGSHGIVRIVEQGYARAREDCASGSDATATHPAGQNRLSK